MKVGLYFGSFNPIHIGHLIIANHILNESGLDKVWFVVSPQNPLKTPAALLNEYNRLHLVEKAIENDQRLKVSSIEFTLPKPSYTAHTLTYLTDKYPAIHFTILMGSDSFQNIGNWKNSEFLIKNFPIIVYKRPGFEVGKHDKPTVTVMDAPLLEISATYIRQSIQQGKSIKYLVPEAVREEIEKGGFYKYYKK